jgi:anti-sigma factor RsiW
MKAKLLFVLALAAGFIPATGCQHVKPWQRGALAEPIMSADYDPVGVQQDEHVFFSREAASGGRGVGGGGCGCN